MANKPKIGLDYFNIQTDIFSDFKVRKLIKYQSSEAVAVYLNLLCTIYREGYYIRWDEELPFAISEATGSKEGYILEVIKCCLQVGLFDKKLYEKESILTSHGIQKRYDFICKLLKRKKIVSEFSLINSEEMGNNSEEMGNNSEEMGNNSEEMLQKKRKEKKIKESIGAPSDFFDKSIQERKTFFKKILKPFEQEYGYEMMNEFYKYWTQIVNMDRMYFEVQNDFYPNIRLRNWKNLGFEKARKQTEENPDFKKLKELYGNIQ